MADDRQLIQKATTELERLELLEPGQVVGGFVVRSHKAYPVIEIGCEGHVSIIRAWLNTMDNLLPIGRSGMFKYNNQDHAMATGILASRTVLGLGSLDPWQVNIDGEYQEALERRPDRGG
jgi:UDP-galactopyranose mutase